MLRKHDEAGRRCAARSGSRGAAQLRFEACDLQQTGQGFALHGASNIGEFGQQTGQMLQFLAMTCQGWRTRGLVIWPFADERQRRDLSIVALHA